MIKTPNPIDRHVGARVRMRRLMVGLSQSKLADALDVTFQQVQKYEKGANRIGASRLQQLARVLEVPPSFFFEGAPSGAPPASGPRLRRGRRQHLCRRLPFDCGRLATQPRLLPIKDPKCARRCSIWSSASPTRPSAASRRSFYQRHLSPVSLADLDPEALALSEAAPTFGVRGCSSPRARAVGDYADGASELPVHQRIGVRRPSRQGLRPHFRRDRRPVLPRGREGRARSLGASAPPARRWPPPTAS